VEDPAGPASKVPTIALARAASRWPGTQGED